MGLSFIAEMFFQMFLNIVKYFLWISKYYNLFCKLLSIRHIHTGHTSLSHGLTTATCSMWGYTWRQPSWFNLKRVGITPLWQHLSSGMRLCPRCGWHPPCCCLEEPFFTQDYDDYVEAKWESWLHYACHNVELLSWAVYTFHKLQQYNIYNSTLSMSIQKYFPRDVFSAKKSIIASSFNY